MISKKSDIAVGVGIIIGAAILYRETLSIPEPRFEVMGSALYPQAILIAMAFLAIVEIVRAVRNHYLPTSEEAQLRKKADEAALPMESKEFRHNYRLRTFVTILALVAYVVILSNEWVNYFIVTFVFGVALTAYLSRWNKKYTLIGAVTVAIILGLLHFLSKTMSIVLPTM